MKVTIKKWNTVATWRWDIPEDDYRGSAVITFTWFESTYLYLYYREY
ncbi:anaphase-promoting complex subunit 11 [Fusarium oxysporum f. sp. lycopersici MN25]|nr:anaphase-promoting complex subunit 11 [Fusarium oxysporum f. sp. lycopersici MN25]